MAGKIYVGDLDTEVKLDCGQDVTSATNPVIKVLKPDGKEVDWSCTVVETTKLRHISTADTFDMKGQYKLQAYPNIAGWTGRGKTKTITVYEKFT